MNNHELNSEEIIIENEFKLSGTLTFPIEKKDKYPAVVLVVGSGKVDRDGTISDLNLKTNIYKDLAETISSLGFATLRYDKRGVGKSDGDITTTGMWDLVDDVTSCFNFLKEDSRIDPDKILLLGHSEGCILITATNSILNPAGLILLSGAAEPLDNALKRQRELSYKELLYQKGIKGFFMRLLKVDKRSEKQARKLFDEILKSDTDTIKYNLTNIDVKWLREHLKYDVINDLKKVYCPVLAITGAKDCQVTPERVYDVANYVKGESESYIIENMDHGLKEFNGDLSILKFKEQYENSINLPLHIELKDILSRWLVENYIESK